MSELKYKVGDCVLIKNIDWYNDNKDEDGIVELSTHIFTPGMSQFCGKVMTIEDVYEDGTYLMMEDTDCFVFTNEMFECKVEEETKPKYEDEVNGEYYSTPKYLVRPSGYQFVDESGNVINARKIVLEKKKKEYPKTYEECCKVLNIAVWDLEVLAHMLDTTETVYRKNLDRLLNSLRKLLICRDAYWKIAGEEMGLGKPWEPDWENPDIDLYVIINIYNRVEKAKYGYGFQHCTFSFPTPEMRDAFKENFDKDLETCKELL